MTAQLDQLPSYPADWTFDEVDAGIERWVAFAEEQGLEFELPSDIPRLLESMRARLERGVSPSMARDIVLQRLAVVTNQALKKAGRDERMRRLVRQEGELLDEPRWLLLSDARMRELVQAGVAGFAVTPGKSLLLNLVTLPLAFGMFFLGYYGVERGRMDLLAGAAACYLLWLLGRRRIRARLNG
jgi:hypothetical protein